MKILSYLIIFFIIGTSTALACQLPTPSIEPSIVPSIEPSIEPSAEPTVEVTVAPTAGESAKVENHGDGLSDGKSDGLCSQPPCNNSGVIIPAGPPNTGRAK